jgi:hypothetical protein
MALDISKERGVPLDRQVFTWRELAGPTYSKLDDDAFTRVRVALMNSIESEAIRFSHGCGRMNARLQGPLARVRRIDQHQQTLVNWLNPADQSPLESTIGYEQAAIEVAAMLAQQEPDPHLAQVYRFGLLEDFDHMYRFSALMDRVYGQDASDLLQGYTDIHPGRPIAVAHRDPTDDLRTPYDKRSARPVSKLNSLTLMAAEHQTRDYYLTIGPQFADPVARQLYAEIASIEEQHVTQVESLIDPTETWLEKWLLHEATEVYNYWSCAETESNKAVRAIWERFLDYELGQLSFVGQLMKEIEHRDPAELLPEKLPPPLKYESQRPFIRETLAGEVDLRAVGKRIVNAGMEPPDGSSARYRAQLNRDGSGSEIVRPAPSPVVGGRQLDERDVLAPLRPQPQTDGGTE